MIITGLGVLSLILFMVFYDQAFPTVALTLTLSRAVAERYLSEDRRWALMNWEEVSASSHDRPGGRTDHYFSWKRLDWSVGESQLRLPVQV